MTGPVQKKCCVCRVDVSGIKRVRDPRGRYYCNPCYQMRFAEYQRRRFEEQQTAASPAQTIVEPEVPHVDWRTQGAATAMTAEVRTTPSQSDDVDHVSTDVIRDASHRFGWAGIMAWLGGRGGHETHGPVELSGASADDHAIAQHVEVQRRFGFRAARRYVRVSDLLGPEALAEVEAARTEPSAEREIPASPIVNPPVSRILAEYVHEHAQA